MYMYMYMYYEMTNITKNDFFLIQRRTCTCTHVHVDELSHLYNAHMLCTCPTSMDSGEGRDFSYCGSSFKVGRTWVTAGCTAGVGIWVENVGLNADGLGFIAYGYKRNSHKWGG